MNFGRARPIILTLPKSRLHGVARGGDEDRGVPTAHKSREPRKYDFSLIFQDQRIFISDFNPGHGYFDKKNLKNIYITQ